LRRPLAELGSGFFQRIFTLKRRPDTHNGKLALIGQPAAHDFALRLPGEDDQAHTALSDSLTSKSAVRAHLPAPGEAARDASPDEKARFHLRRITGEALPKAVVASMGEGALPDAQNRYGAREKVDQIDAATAITSDYGIDGCWKCIGDPGIPLRPPKDAKPESSPRSDLHGGQVFKANDLRFALSEALNSGMSNEDRTEVRNVFICLDNNHKPRPLLPAKLLIQRSETAKEARFRWQHAQVARSFHGAVFGGRKNHSQVTAYDVAIGRGTASTDPLFYAYLCMVADWRLKKPKDKQTVRPGIQKWTQLKSDFGTYWNDERPWRKAIIEGNSDYYSNGVLPSCLPLPPEGLPSTVEAQSMSGPGARNGTARR
jgi:hypothetical protein